ncbi:hypothetical protein BH09BAC3_BH09BAC3_17520 [soil metagenome]
MNVKFSHLLASFIAVFLLGISAQAQDELPSVELQDPTHREYNLQDDKALIYDYPTHLPVRDSLQVVRVLPTTQPAKPSKADVQKKDEEDALSFNFIYYFIQKFKMSDLIDQ